MFLNNWRFMGSSSDRLLTLTIVIIIVSLLPLRRAVAATTWTVTVTYDATAKDISYSVESDNQVCGTAPGPTNPYPNPITITVCPNDIVQFVAATQGGQNELVILVPDAILATGFFKKSKKHFHASDGQLIKTYVSGKPGGTEHEYHILLVDRTQPTGAGTHCKDPKIIIGTGRYGTKKK